MYVCVCVRVFMQLYVCVCARARAMAASNNIANTYFVNVPLSPFRSQFCGAKHSSAHRSSLRAWAYSNATTPMAHFHMRSLRRSPTACFASWRPCSSSSLDSICKFLCLY